MLLGATMVSHGSMVTSSAPSNMISLVEGTSSQIVSDPEISQPNVGEQKPIVSAEQYVRNYYADEPILAKISYCESKFKQYDGNGNILRGMVYHDVGVMQINETYHKVAAEKMGLDIYTFDGNLAYAKWLYEKEGTSPWSASEHCWSQM